LYSRDTVVGVVTEKSLFDSQQEAGTGNFCLLHTIKTNPGALEASDSFGTGGSFLWGSGPETDHSPNLRQRKRMMPTATRPYAFMAYTGAT